MSNGTSGDINNINFREPGTSQQPGEQMTRVAHAAADVVHAAYSRLQWHDWVALGAAATVWVDGQEAGYAAWPPCQVDITRLLKPGKGRYEL